MKGIKKMYKAIYRFTVLGIVNSFEEAEQLSIDRYGIYDPDFAFIELI